MKKSFLKPVLVAALISFLSSCGTKAPVLVGTPIEQIDTQVLKVQPLTEKELESWGTKDLANDTIPGMSIEKAYTELLKDKKGVPVIVGVVDSGVDIEHEDLKNVIWTNPNEIPNNGIDDDKNGYIDDIHGWNFLGDTVGENMEYVRIIRDYEKKTSHSPAETEQYNRAKTEYEKEFNEAEETLTYYKGMLTRINKMNEALIDATGKKDYTVEDLKALKTENSDLIEAKVFAMGVLGEGNKIEDITKRITKGIDYFENRLSTHFNKSLYGRKTKDNINDLNDKYYGNNDVDGPDPKKEDAEHGTHVAGIIAAQRNNGIGMNGVADNVKIMAVRAVPDGDEYDKDIALALRYAVDNGAKVINTSFGKSFSTNPEWVIDAIKYAADHDVLIVNAAGNDNINIDNKRIYPNDQTPDNTTEITDNFLTVGASNFEYGENLVADFSNYGKTNVDIFAPGTKIWSTVPLNKYEFLQGTSMAAPAVAGIAAVIRSYYPKLSAKQVKQIIMDSGIPVKSKVIVPGTENIVSFEELSVSGKIANLYNALLMASKITNKK